jgi:hypothetical protein
VRSRIGRSPIAKMLLRIAPGGVQELSRNLSRVCVAILFVNSSSRGVGTGTARRGWCLPRIDRLRPRIISRRSGRPARGMSPGRCARHHGRRNGRPRHHVWLDRLGAQHRLSATHIARGVVEQRVDDLTGDDRLRAENLRLFLRRELICASFGRNERLHGIVAASAGFGGFTVERTAL